MTVEEVRAAFWPTRSDYDSFLAHLDYRADQVAYIELERGRYLETDRATAFGFLNTERTLGMAWEESLQGQEAARYWAYHMETE